MKKNIIISIAIVALSAIGYFSYKVYMFEKAVAEKAEKGDIAFRCLNEGKCAYDIVLKYQKYLLEQANNK